MNASTQPPPSLPRPPQYSQPPPPAHQSQQQQQQPTQQQPSIDPQYDLFIVQQPERGKVVVRNKEKDRRPIDPPPIIQVHCRYEVSQCSYHHNPYLFCTVSLYDEAENVSKQGDSAGLPPLVGYTSSSMHRLKDLTNNEGAFFVFGDLAATVTGKARLHFSLWEVRPRDYVVVLHKTIVSQVMDVQSARDWEGTKESTMLSRSFSEQGVKLRLRKESRASQRRSMLQPPPHMPPVNVPPHGHSLAQRALPPIQGSFDDDGTVSSASSSQPLGYQSQHFQPALAPSQQSPYSGYSSSAAQGYPSMPYGSGYASSPSYITAPQGQYYGQAYRNMPGYGSPASHQSPGQPPPPPPQHQQQQQQQPPPPHSGSSQQGRYGGYPQNYL